MENLNNPFGVPSPGQPQSQPDNIIGDNTKANDQPIKASTVIE